MSNWMRRNSPPNSVSHATLTYSHYLDEEDDLPVDPEQLVYDPDTDDEEENPFLLNDLGGVDLSTVLQAIDTICEKYLSDLESDLIWLMRQGRRPVEISRILRIPECEVVRLRRNCFRKIRTVYLYDYHHNKQNFLAMSTALLNLNPKQTRIFTMFFNYYGLRQIAQTIGTRPSNIHRSLQMMRRKLQAIAAADEHGIAFDHFYLNAFDDFKYLCLTLRAHP
jgi:DNA-directed RNA polymerase specialized sigma24 family protein